MLLFRDYEAKGHSAVDVKKEVEMHLAEKEILEAALPSSVVIGPFHVNTDNVRQALTKKRKALSNAVLEVLARALRKQADEVRPFLSFIVSVIFVSYSNFPFG